MRRTMFASVALWILASGALAQQAGLAPAAEPRPLPAFPELQPPALQSPELQPPALQSPELQPPDLPPVIVTVEPQSPPALRPAASFAADLPPPDLPPVTVVVAPLRAAADAPAIDIAPPDLPDVQVVVEALTPSDIAQAIGARLAQEGPPAHPRLTRAMRDEIAAFYAARANRPLWVDVKGVAPAGQSIIARLGEADEDGLDATAYPVPPAALSDAAALAAADLQITTSAFLYARDARGGRIDARRLSNLIDPTLDLPAVANVAAALSAASDAGKALQDFNPPHAGYRALRARLRDLRANAEPVASVSIPNGPVLRVGMSDSRVALLRERLKLAPLSDTTYDATVAAAVSEFQRERGLRANGTLTPRTVAALSAPNVPRLEANIVANMERWRWLPRDLGERHIIVNIPEYEMRVVDDGKVTHEVRVIVGRPDTPTPVFSDRMQFLVLNPSWYVPPSILKKEFLPKLASDPGYAQRRGYEVIRRGNQITVRQPPGERNALGNIKFMFPNRHAVYLHDTPTRNLFASDRRAFSHGCVRVDKPLQFAEIVLGKENGWTEERVRSLIGRGERSVKMEQTIPIHLVYFTTFVDENGKLQTRDDIYGHDRRVRAALGLDG